MSNHVAEIERCTWDETDFLSCPPKMCNSSMSRISVGYSSFSTHSLTLIFTWHTADSSLQTLCCHPKQTRRTVWIIHGQTDGKCEGEPVLPRAGTDLDSVAGLATGRERPLRNGGAKMSITKLQAATVTERRLCLLLSVTNLSENTVLILNFILFYKVCVQRSSSRAQMRHISLLLLKRAL